MWPLTRKRSLGMNARQANAQQVHGWETDSRAVRNRSGERMKKMFAWMQSNGNVADENFERMQSNGYTGDAKIFEPI